MPLVSDVPDTVELPELRLAGACSFASFFDSQSSLLGEPWSRLHDHLDAIPNRVRTERMFGLELYPPAFRYICDELVPRTDRKLAGTFDLEFDGEEFMGPCEAGSLTHLLLPLA